MLRILQRQAQVGHGNKFVRLMRVFDGSVTNCVQALTGQEPKIQLAERMGGGQETLIQRKLKSDVKTIERVIAMSTEEHPKPYLIARSIWCQESYNSLLGEKKHLPIGKVIRMNKTELFHEIVWTGTSTIEYQNTIYENIQCRVSVFIFKGQVVCQLEEYFTNHFYDLFK